jgi:hypothetical protein
MIAIAAIIKKKQSFLGTLSKFINGESILEEKRVLIEAAIHKFDFKVNGLSKG